MGRKIRSWSIFGHISRINITQINELLINNFQIKFNLINKCQVRKITIDSIKTKSFHYMTKILRGLRDSLLLRCLLETFRVKHLNELNEYFVQNSLCISLKEGLRILSSKTGGRIEENGGFGREDLRAYVEEHLKVDPKGIKWIKEPKNLTKKLKEKKMDFNFQSAERKISKEFTRTEIEELNNLWSSNFECKLDPQIISLRESSSKEERKENSRLGKGNQLK